MPEYRLAHYLALCGVASRKQAARLIDAGRVTLDDKQANHSHKVDTLAPVTVFVDGQPIADMAVKQYWIYHKPVGINCNLLAHDPHSLIHQLPTATRLFPVGRLDKDSRGLLLLTNDGQLLQQLMHPQYHYPKTYQVQVDKPITPEFIQQMASGVSYKDVTTRPCKVTAIDDFACNDKFEICLTQGMNRQIRRMCLALGFKVIDLHRVAIGELNFGLLEENSMRPLTALELAALTPDTA